MAQVRTAWPDMPSASLMMKREITARVIMTCHQPGTNISAHIEKEIAKVGLPLMETKLHRLVAFQEMSFTGIVPVSGIAGAQCASLLEEIAGLRALIILDHGNRHRDDPACQAGRRPQGRAGFR